MRGGLTFLVMCACAGLSACSSGAASEPSSAPQAPAAASGGEVRASWEPAQVTASQPLVQYASSAEMDSEEMAPASAPASAGVAAQQRSAARANLTPTAPKPTWSGQAASDGAKALTDAPAGPLLIYQAELYMAVYKVEQIQEQAIAVTRELGGYLSEHTDRTKLVLRVPAAQFDAAVKRIEALGEVTHRFVRAQDVTAQFRDLEMRMRNAEAVRDRLLKLLDKAPDVPQSLSVETELSRITEHIEQMKGQLKLLSDQIAFSTVTINFSVKRSETISDDFSLPFPWLQTLGLQHLLSFQ